MLFNSLAFITFFSLFYVVYLSTMSYRRLQNFILLGASYIFYAYWDWRFLSLLLISTLVDYFIGRRFHQLDQKVELDGSSLGKVKSRKRLLVLSIVCNLGILGFFKYFNFFTESTLQLLNLMEVHVDPVWVNIILPIGISFYTFQTLSYTIDVYRGQLKPCSSLLSFAVFVSFFPQLVAGPIERAANLLPQIERRRLIDSTHVLGGLSLIVLGYFKKIFIADNLALIVNPVFVSHSQYHGLDIGLAVAAFTIQIYCDFSGYSDIARGLSRLLGFELMVNFRLPYFALNPSDFWQRWHISLSSWLRDYVYISLGGNRRGRYFTFRNLIATMLLGGLWHGASWNFILWGAYHGALLVVYRWWSSLKLAASDHGPWFLKAATSFGRWGLMLSFTLLGWLIFRASGWEQVVDMSRSFSFETSRHTLDFMKTLVFFSWPLVVLELFQHQRKNLLCMTQLPAVWQGSIYGVMLVWIVLFGQQQSMEFIYFQF